MHYRRYVVRTRLFALRSPQQVRRVLATFAGTARRLAVAASKPRTNEDEPR